MDDLTERVEKNWVGNCRARPLNLCWELELPTSRPTRSATSTLTSKIKSDVDSAIAANEAGYRDRNKMLLETYGYMSADLARGMMQTVRS